MVWDKVKGALFEDSSPQAQAATPAKPAPSVTAKVTAAPLVSDNKFVEALQTAIKNRATAYTALLTAADKLVDIIPDPNMRLRAAYAQVAGEGRGVAQIMAALEIHTSDLEGQRMSFKRQAESTAQAAIATKKTELATVEATVTSSQQQIQNMTEQIQALQGQIAEKTTRAAELRGEISAEESRFELAGQQFDAALNIVKADLDGQRLIIQSALQK
jgi:chromosome segregation ATPase